MLLLSNLWLISSLVPPPPPPLPLHQEDKQRNKTLQNTVCNSLKSISFSIMYVVNFTGRPCLSHCLFIKWPYYRIFHNFFLKLWFLSKNEREGLVLSYSVKCSVHVLIESRKSHAGAFLTKPVRCKAYSDSTLLVHSSGGPSSFSLSISFSPKKTMTIVRYMFCKSSYFMMAAF